MEQHIDTLLSEQMSDPDYLRRLAMRMQAPHGADRRASQIERLEGGRNSLERKRQRLIDMFMEGDIGKAEKDERLPRIGELLAGANRELSRLNEAAPATMTAAQLAQMFTVFARWNMRPKDDRRKLLS